MVTTFNQDPLICWNFTTSPSHRFHHLPRGGYRIYERGGHHILMKRCRRQCIEVRSADQSARSAEKIFRLHFSLLRMGSRGTFALCTASSRCTRIAGARAAMSAQISPTNVIRTYTEGYTRSWSRSHAYYIGNDMDSILRISGCLSQIHSRN